MSKFKDGERVRIISRSRDRYCGLERIGSEGIVTIVSETDNKYEIDNSLGWYAESDLRPLTNQGGAQMARKTYKLIKDTPTVKKGAIYQEACDDGTQEYILLDGIFIKDTKGGSNFKAPIYDRSLVEDAPNWFVEVFQIEPQFMTAPELEQWEAFKATKTKKSVAKVVDTPKTSAWTPARRKAQSEKIKAAWAAKKAAA